MQNLSVRDQRGDSPLRAPLSAHYSVLKFDQTTQLLKKSASYTVLKHGDQLTQSQMDALELFANNVDKEEMSREFPEEENQEMSSGSIEINISLPQQLEYQTTAANPRYAAEEQRARIENLRSQCSRMNSEKRPLSRNNLTDFYFSRQHNFAYCKVPKSGSTFWMKLFMILLKGDNYSKVMSKWSRAEIHLKSKMLVASPVRILRGNVRTIIVSRNPYTRLYSAYIDKVYQPLFWDRFARMEGVFQKPSYFVNSTQMMLKGSRRSLTGRLMRYATQLMKKGLLEQRNISTKVTPICANNASFEQFLSFVIADSMARKTLEPHWAPISHLCHPCRFNTFKIVKQEDFSHDVEHTLRSVNIDLGKFPSIHDTLYENRAKNSIPGIISVVQNRAFSRNVNVCITQQEIVRRVWKSLQIQGFIRDDEPLPSSLLNEEGFNKFKVTAAVLNAINRNPMTPKERQQQRRLHLVNAYKTISKDTIKQIQALYNLDFILFNYSMIPPS